MTRAPQPRRAPRAAGDQPTSATHWRRATGAVHERPRGVLRWLGVAGRLTVARLRGAPVLLAATLAQTHRCNLRCVYCSSPLLHTPELSPAAWIKIVDELAALGCRRVGFLGGEPLLRADVFDLIAHARARGMACVLTSNGVLVPRVIERLRPLSTLVLSLDAAGPANDRVRGPGVFAAVTEAISAARGASIPVKINAVVSDATVGELDSLLAYVAAQAIPITLNVVRSGTPALWHDARTVKPGDEVIRACLERLADLSRTNPQILFSEQTYRYASRWGDYGRDRVEVSDLTSRDPRLVDAPRCHAGRAYLSIQPDGSTSPCTVTAGQVTGGNVARDGVEAAWRALHDHPCRACYTPCLVEQNYLCSLDRRVIGPFLRRHAARFG